MGAREELAAIRERVDHQPCCDHSGADEHGCWDCRWTGHAHPPYIDGAAADDMARLLGALDAVVEIREWIRRAQFMRVEVPMFDIAQRLDGALAALTTDTKGEPR